jgi:antitoxin VapB
MTTAKLFVNGQSQAVRLPKECRFEGTEVGVRKIGNLVVLFPKDKALEIFLDSEPITDDVAGAINQARRNEAIRERELL